LYVEHVLIEFISHAVENPEAIEFSKLSFPSKVELAIALNLIEKELMSPLKILNSLRNKVAHNLRYKFTDEDKRQLYYSLPVVYQELAATKEGDFAKEIPREEREFLPIDKVTINRIFEILIITLDYRRDSFAQSLAERKKAFDKLATAVENYWREYPKPISRDGG
jgi:hypothetical protein